MYTAHHMLHVYTIWNILHMHDTQYGTRSSLFICGRPTIEHHLRIWRYCHKTMHYKSPPEDLSMRVNATPAMRMRFVALRSMRVTFANLGAALVTSKL